MRTLYIDGFFVFGLALTTVPVVGPSSPRFSMPLISARTSYPHLRRYDIGTIVVRQSPFFATVFGLYRMLAAASRSAAERETARPRGSRHPFHQQPSAACLTSYNRFSR